jgi:tetrathionate reductase subunit B
MSRYAMVIDMDRCITCHACEVACRAEYDVPVPHYRNWVHELPPQGVYPDIKKTSYVGLCNQCDDSPCTKACPTEATFKRENGLVVVDRDLCIGCGLCIEACPYGARYYNPVIEKVDKCDFCEARIGKGLEPTCVQTCIADARIFGDLDDPNSAVSKLVAAGTKTITSEQVSIGPNIYYKDEREVFPVVAAVFPPKQPVTPTPQKWMSKVLIPLFTLAIAGSFLGQAAAFALQLFKGESDIED